VDVPLSSALSGVKMAVLAAADLSERRKLTMAPQPRCSRACNGCCSRHLEVTVAEASVVVSHLKGRGGWREVRDEAKAQVPVAKVTPPSAWFKLNIKCPVLDRGTGLCRAHPVRPPACSTHYATSDPSACDPWSSSQSEYRPVVLGDVFAEAQKEIRSGLASDGILTLQLPMPVALLMADRVSLRSGLSYDEAISLINNEL
jgi:Fe-S-cluster containining protein